MNSFLCLCLAIATTLRFADGRSSIAFKEPSRCGDWLPFKDEKCIKIAHKAGTQTQEDGEIVCEAYSTELSRESYPKLITIRYEEDQQFFQRFLFTENNIIDDVWLGLKETDTLGEYKWNDGSSVRYSNWASQNVTDKDHHCVAMASGKGHDAVGLWVKVHCEKRIAVACERTQTWSLETLQNMFLNHKLDLQLQQNISEQKIRDLETKHHEALKKLEENKVAFEEKIRTMQTKLETEMEQKAGNVPIGFIYIQYPNQTSPADLWPFAKWKDVSSTYAGLFFRVAGGNAAAFGELQEANDTKLAQVERLSGSGDGGGVISLPLDGAWSGGLHTGWQGGTKPYLALHFRLSSGEVRPRNKAVIIWQRIQ